MSTAELETPINLPVEVAALLWADAYRATLRPALQVRLPADELAALDRAVERIEHRIFSSPPKLALSA